MNRENAKEYIKDHIEEYLSSKGINTNKNFKCLTGIHIDNTPSMSLDKTRNKVKCFGQCGANLDTLDIIGIDNNTNDFNEQLNIGCEYFNITLDKDYKDYLNKNKELKKSSLLKTNDDGLEIIKKYLKSRW